LADVPSDFALLLPPGWVRLPLDGREHERVVAIVNVKVQELPAEVREGLRRLLTRDLLGALAKAREAGGVDVFLSLSEVEGAPIAASCLVTFLDARSAVPLDGLVLDLAGEGARTTVVCVADAPAVRRETVAELDAGEHVLRTTTVDFFIPLPASTGLLVLSFATAIEPLAEALVHLFDAMAESLRWVHR
jgi:hypothetical protein